VTIVRHLASLLALVSPRGFPVALEVFDGDTADVMTLEEIVAKMENKYDEGRGGV
jgi:transposase